jgi:hypothetical protein
MIFVNVLPILATIHRFATQQVTRYTCFAALECHIAHASWLCGMEIVKETGQLVVSRVGWVAVLVEACANKH